MNKLSLKEKFKNIKRDVIALARCLHDPRVPWYARAMILVAAGYALSPIDLIPDFIPVLGYLDDLIIVPLLVLLAIKLIPKEVFEEYRNSDAASPSLKRAVRGAAAFTIAVWCGTIIAIIVWVAGCVGRSAS